MLLLLLLLFLNKKSVLSYVFCKTIDYCQVPQISSVDKRITTELVQFLNVNSYLQVENQKINSGSYFSIQMTYIDFRAFSNFKCRSKLNIHSSSSHSFTNRYEQWCTVCVSEKILKLRLHRYLTEGSVNVNKDSVSEFRI